MAVSRQRYDLSERRACAMLGVSRSVQRYRRRGREDEEVRLREEILDLARRHRRFGYRRITRMLQAAGWRVNHKRVERIWREEGLRVRSQTGAEAQACASARWLLHPFTRPLSEPRLEL